MRASPRPDATSGSPADVDALFVAERVPMVRMAVLMVGSAETAEEVVQEAFAAVGQRWDELEQPGAYLRTTVVNGCRAVLRRRALEQRYEADLVALSPGQIPDRLIELRDALDRLTERQRVVIVLRYFVDLPDREIAQVLECRPATVRSLARRGLAALREELT